jgi:hypothetical protein
MASLLWFAMLKVAARECRVAQWVTIELVALYLLNNPLLPGGVAS